MPTMVPVTLYQWDKGRSFQCLGEIFPDMLTPVDEDDWRSDVAHSLPRGYVQGAAHPHGAVPRDGSITSTFYSGGDFWEGSRPTESDAANARLQPPYYISLQMPGRTELSSPSPPDLFRVARRTETS